ncbi:MAG: T9SS type A sorting domain-containing protein [Bacteroidetes bacterium]|nr:T9SS type A sorting domain-containing protein [Bacteroidota bacterium]MBU1114976.1 T9SS type A sorting domain-containing protein [Bacteroidota bacterium]MBU1798700.1 T9SS type A sorting domain-containing protein [Bacteroidota bacterium]
MIKIYFYLLVLFSFTSSFSQDLKEYSVHESQYKEFKKNNSQLNKFSFDGSEIIPLQVNSKKELSKIVFGYLPDWEYNNGSHANQHYDLLTHIATFDFMVSSNGTVGFPSNWPWTDVINAAHTAGTKVIMTAVNFDALDIRNIISNETAKQKFFLDTKNIIQTYQLDGVNVDFEDLYNADKGSLINNFMTELTTYIHTNLPGKEVSFAGPAVNWSNLWDLDGLVQSCDYVFIMGYSFWGGWSTTAGPCAPLSGFSNDITSVVTEDYGVPLSKYPEKLILGVPYYGHQWRTVTGNAYSKIDTLHGGYQGSTRFYNDIDKADIYGLLWDNISQTSWFRWQEGTQWNQIWFDDVKSIEKKYDLALSQNLGGVGMWALGYDGDKQDLWNLIDYKFGSASLPVPNKPKSFRVIQNNENTLVLSFEAVNYAEKYGVYLSYDGLNFEKITESVSNTISITNLETDSIYYFKVDAINSSGNSTITEVLAGIPSYTNTKILIVNGFDRTSDTENTFDFIRMYEAPMKNLQLTFSSTSNEAVFKNFVNLKDYQIVIWMLMDESSTDDTFNSLEQNAVMNFIDSGGVLVVSGSEIGWDLVAKGSEADMDFYHNYLMANYIDDAPNGEQSTYYSTYNLNNTDSQFNFDDGTHGTINVDWPDAIEAFGSIAVNSYAFKNVPTSKGFAGISYLNRANGAAVEYLSFPIEAVYNDFERTRLISELLEPHIIRPSVEEDNLTPNEFVLHQNYPNPFNPTTTIKYSIPEELALNATHVKLIVYDILGREVATIVNQVQQAGNYEVVFDASKLSSGTYLYRILSGKFSDSKKMILLR